MRYSYFIVYDVRTGHCHNTYSGVVDVPYRLTEQTWSDFTRYVKTKLLFGETGVIANVSYLGFSED